MNCFALRCFRSSSPRRSSPSSWAPVPTRSAVISARATEARRSGLCQCIVRDVVPHHSLSPRYTASLCFLRLSPLPLHPSLLRVSRAVPPVTAGESPLSLVNQHKNKTRKKSIEITPLDLRCSASYHRDGGPIVCCLFVRTVPRPAVVNCVKILWFALHCFAAIRLHLRVSCLSETAPCTCLGGCLPVPRAVSSFMVLSLPIQFPSPAACPRTKPASPWSTCRIIILLCVSALVCRCMRPVRARGSL